MTSTIERLAALEKDVEELKHLLLRLTNACTQIAYALRDTRVALGLDAPETKEVRN